MRYLPELPRWNPPAIIAWRPTRVAGLPLALAACALSGWGAFAGRAASQRDLAQQVSLLQADRDGLTGRLRQTEQANAELLRDWQGKLASARDELNQTAAARDGARTQLASAQRELLTLKKRLDQARDRVAETGSIRAGETSKKPAAKP
ncbi:hypothetical protein [Methylobacterium nigriterrae]|uniref:hypothetical protein n=1 Tax=Methylobacterium nigriterrae TaxID=3127512 RepID=UPI003013280A